MSDRPQPQERHERQVIRLAEMASRDPIIRNKDFEDCEILGPGMVVLLGHVTLSECSFDAPPDILVVVIPGDRAVVGAIGLENVRFYGCRFRGVGFLGPEEMLADFKREMPA